MGRSSASPTARRQSTMMELLRTPESGDDEAEAEWTPLAATTPEHAGDEYEDDDDLADFIVDDEEELEEAEDDEENGGEHSEAEEDGEGDLVPRSRLRSRGSSSFATTSKRTPRRTRRTKRGVADAELDDCNRQSRTRRREIAAILDDDDLEDSTRRAREAEKLRAQQMIDVSEDGAMEVVMDDSVVNGSAAASPRPAVRVCLNPRAEDGKPPTGPRGTPEQPVFVHAEVGTRLKPHQVKGTRFLWSHVAVEPHGFGCILADFMGLGKTLQVITVVQAFLTLQRLIPQAKGSEDGRRRSGFEDDPDDMADVGASTSPEMVLARRHKHVLILAPTICVRNWEAEIVKWLGKKDARRLGVHTLESSREKKVTDRVHVIQQWHKRGGILIMGYELYRILVLQSSGEEKIAAGNAKHAHLIKQVYSCLCDPGPDLIVLDEGHRVRDHKSKLVKALAHVKTARRIILTGYPLQNHLEEYWTMVNFARPDYLGSLEDFKNRFVNPIENGQCIDSTEEDRRLARQRAFILTNELKTLVLRRDQEYLFRQLPPKKEWVILCRLTEPQASLYRRFLDEGVPKRNELLPGVGGKVDVLGGYHISLAISNHPDVLQETYQQLEEAIRSGKLLSASAKAAARRKKSGNADDDEDLLDYLTGDLGTAGASKTVPKTTPIGDTSISDDDEMSILAALDAPTHASSAPKASAVVPSHRLSFAQEFLSTYTPGMLESSGKMMILMELLKECKEIGDRVILFSQSIPTLNTVEKMIAHTNRRHRRHSDRLAYLRIDGSTPQLERFRMIGQFNDWEEPIDLIMISTKAGGEGVNLCAGNRIIIFDVCWNPCNDSQSMCRSYRFGQVKPVFVYRFVSAGTMEKKVYDLQIRKEGVAKRIVDEKALERKFKNADLQNYFNPDEFEEAMRQQSAVLSALAPSASDGPGEASVGVGPKGFPVVDEVLTRVLQKMQGDGAGWVLDWFEQETMFEETLDDACTEAEQEEITASYRYVKALRRIRVSDSSWNPRALEGVLVVACAHCRMTNSVYPQSMTNVPVPKTIECQYCQRAVPTAGATTRSEAAAAAAAQSQSFAPGSGLRAVPHTPVPSAMAVDTGNTAGHDGPGGRALPPHLQALHRQQQQQQMRRLPSSSFVYSGVAPALDTNSLLLRDQLARQQEATRQLARRAERQKMKLGDRHLLIIRRGINSCQDLKKSAQECGATIAIEVNPQLTDIVSGLPLDETLRWLKLTKLPADVNFHDDQWLRGEIAKEKTQATPGAATAPAISFGGSGVKTSTTPRFWAPPAPSIPFSGSTPTFPARSPTPTISIDLSDESDTEVVGVGGPAPGRAAPAAARPGLVAAPPPPDNSGEDDDSDVIEIL